MPIVVRLGHDDHLVGVRMAVHNGRVTRVSPLMVDVIAGSARLAADPDVRASLFGWGELVLPLCSNPVMHVVVAGALIENGAVLLVHRRPTRRAYPDLWDLPGGHVEAGESELQALAREIREELGVHIVAESSSRLGDFDAGNGEDAVHVGVWQVGDWVGTPTNRAPDEHDDIAWVGISELDGLPLAHGDVAALVRSLPKTDPPPRRDEACGWP